MRYFVCLVVGLFTGVLIAMTISNAMQRRNAWPRALMNVMQHELGDARTLAKGAQCTTPAMSDASAHLRLLAGDIERALMAPGTQDRVFTQYAGDMRKTIAAWDSSATCAQQAEALTTIANACEACHRDYR